MADPATQHQEVEVDGVAVTNDDDVKALRAKKSQLTLAMAFLA